MKKIFKITVITVILGIWFSSCKEKEDTVVIYKCTEITDLDNLPWIRYPYCIEFDDSITEIPDSLYRYYNPNYPAFSGNLKSITGKGIIIVGEYAFWNNEISKLDLPLITTLGHGAFGGNWLESISLPEVTYIGNSAFSRNWLTNIELPKVVHIGKHAFYESCIKSVSLPNAITIDDEAFYYNRIATLYLPKVTVIGGGAFARNQLRGSLYLPKVISIGDYAFGGNGLTSLDLPEVITIGEWAFSTNQLTTVYLPKVTYLERFALGGNPDLTEVHIYTNPDILEIAPAMFFSIFAGNKNKITIYIENADWKAGMEAKFAAYNVEVKVIE